MAKIIIKQQQYNKKCNISYFVFITTTTTNAQCLQKMLDAYKIL